MKTVHAKSEACARAQREIAGSMHRVRVGVAVEQFLKQQEVDVGRMTPEHHENNNFHRRDGQRRIIDRQGPLDDDLALARRKLPG